MCHFSSAELLLICAMKKTIFCFFVSVPGCKVEIGIAGTIPVGYVAVVFVHMRVCVHG